MGGNSELDDAKDDAGGEGGAAEEARGAYGTDADGCLPGGDISIAGFEVAPIRGTHVLAFNKFCAYRPHLLLLTADGRRRQFEALDAGDLAAARDVLLGLNGAGGRGGDGGAGRSGQQEYLVIFNCGREGGCSRLHKHMQVIPAPDAIPLWPDTVTSPTAAEGAQGEPPFRYSVQRFGPGGGNGAGEVPSAEDLAVRYRSMLLEATRAVPGRESVVEEDGDGKGVAVPHNVILGRRWIVVIPRRRADVDGAGVNAAGMLGVVWAAGDETVDTWRGRGPRWILGEVGVRK